MLPLDHAVQDLDLTLFILLGAADLLMAGKHLDCSQLMPSFQKIGDYTSTNGFTVHFPGIKKAFVMTDHMLDNVYT